MEELELSLFTLKMMYLYKILNHTMSKQYYSHHNHVSSKFDDDDDDDDIIFWLLYFNHNL